MPALSVSEAVGDAVKAAIDALGLTSGVVPAAVPVVKRKVPSLPEGKDPPGIAVSVGEEGAVEYLTAVWKLKKYPAAVTIITAGGEKAADDPTVRDWRQRIETKLEKWSSYAAVTGFNDVEAVGKAPFDASALSKDFNYSVQVFTVSVVEARTQ